MPSKIYGMVIITFRRRGDSDVTTSTSSTATFPEFLSLKEAQIGDLRLEINYTVYSVPSSAVIISPSIVIFHILFKSFINHSNVFMI